MEGGTSYRRNGLGNENKAGMDKPRSEDSEEVTLARAVGSHQKVRRYVAQVDEGHLMEI